MSSKSTPDRQKKVLDILARDREVLESHKVQVPTNYTTGRGGAGAKGHVKVKGKVPNRERALAKEREIQARWKEARDKASNLRTGRGGHGNLLKVVSNDNASMAPSRIESRDGSLDQGRPFSPFGTTSSEKARRRRFSLNHKPLSARSGSTQSYYTGQDTTRASSATNKRDPPWDTDSYSGLESAGIVTSKEDPSADRSATPAIVGAHRIPNETFPVEERTQSRKLRKPSLKIPYNPSVESSSSTTSTTAPHPNSLLRPFKKLHLPKSHEIESIPASVVIDISSSVSSTHPYTPHSAPISIDADPLAYSYRTDWTVASNVLQMVDPSQRTFIPPSRILTPPPPSAPPTTPAQPPMSDDLESVSGTGYDSSPTSDTFGSITTHANQSFLSASPSTPARSTPAKLPIFYFQESVPPRGKDIRWSKRPLPIPPASTHTLLRPPSTHSVPSPPSTPVEAELESRSATPMALPSSYHTAFLPSSPISDSGQS